MGLSQTKFADKLSIHKITLLKYEKGEQAPSIEVVDRILFTTKCDPGWLLTGKEPEAPVSISDGPYFRAPVEGEAGAGPAVINQIEEIKDEAVLSVGIKRRYGPGEYIAVWVRGDSMAPTLPHGAMVAVRKDHYELASLKWEHVYLVNVPAEGGPVLKKVVAAPKQGSITLHSINTIYPPVTYNLKTDHIQIIGRVVGVVWAPL